MANRKITQHPEYTGNYNAIDGIAKPEIPNWDNSCSLPPEKAIRSDVEKILDMNDVQFEAWFTPKKEATEMMLKHYETFASIPHLVYGGENQQYNMDAITAVKQQIEAFKKGMEYLEIIKNIREESKDK